MLDEDEHFLHNRDASVATLRELFAFGPECRSRSLRNQCSPSPESSRTLEDEPTLRMALSRRVIEPGLAHHSDRGSQYASGDYTDLLKDNGIQISMSRKGNP